MFLRIWEYDAVAETAADFLAVYGATGDWACLFAESDGFAGTELFRSTGPDDRFVTVDRWRSYTDWLRFLDRRSDAYEALDRRLGHLTTAQRMLWEGCRDPET